MNAPNPQKFQSFNVTESGIAITGFTKVELGTHTRKTLKSMDPAALIELHNANAEATLTRFASQEAGVEKTWAAMCNNCQVQLDSIKPVTTLLDHEPKAGGAVTKTAAAKEPKAPKEPKIKRGMNLSQKEPKPLKEGTNQYKVAMLLVRPEGALMREMQDAIGPTKHNPIAPETSIRSILNWDINKVKGYGVQSTHGADGLERFKIVFEAPVTELLLITKEAAEAIQQASAKAATDAKKAKSDAKKPVVPVGVVATLDPDAIKDLKAAKAPKPAAKASGKSHGAAK